MALIDFYVRNQKLSKTGPKIVGDSINYINCSFTFKTDDWDGASKWVVFSKGDENYRVNLVDDAIPKEAGLNIGAGLWNVSLFGEKDGTRITTNSVTVEVEKSAVPEGGPLPAISQTEAEQIDAKARSALNKAEAVSKAAENGEFNGEQGPKGDAFTYDDFTDEQLAALKGEKGDKGDPFTYDDFTDKQLAGLKGEKGDKGDAFTYNDFTDEQLADLKGEKGDKGDAFTYNDFTDEQLADLKGDKGDKGDPFTFEDFTEEQLAALKGEKGDKGDPFTYDDFTDKQLANLKGEKGDPGKDGLTTSVNGVVQQNGEITIIRKTSVVLSASGWNGNSQSISVANVTAKSKVDIQPDSAVIEQMLNDEVVGLYIENNAGTLTVKAVGGVPKADLTLQITLTEVSE